MSWYNILSLNVGIGVTWFVYSQAGFWQAILYGVFWEIWVGYRLAEWLWR